MIYFDSAATSALKPKEVAQAVYDAIDGGLGNALRGAHDASLSALRLITETRELISELFHFSYVPGVVFTFNATDSLNIVINGLFEPGDHIVTTVMEHNSVLRPLYRLEKEKITHTIVPCNSKYTVETNAIETALQKNTRAVICTHASNLTGNVNDIADIGRLCRERRILFLVDASQTAGVLPIDMEAMGIDVLCFSGHKGLLGAQGTGGICMREGIACRPLRVGGSGVRTFAHDHPDTMPTALEAGTLNTHGIAGLNAGLKYLLRNGVEQLYAVSHGYAEYFGEELGKLSSVALYSDYGNPLHVPTVAFNIGDIPSSSVSDELMRRFGIATRAGGHCAPLMHRALGTGTQGAVRCSFSHLNTWEEVRQGVAAVKAIAYGKE